MIEEDIYDEEEPSIRPYRVTTVARRVKRPIVIEGERVTLYRSPEVVEYVDTSTGEIFRASDLHRQKAFPAPINFGERVLEREAILNGLRREVRDFALFVLKFRNQRRGITPGIDALVKWYADLRGKQTSHVRRYVPQLVEAQVLAGESLVGPLFQIAGTRTTARDHLAESCAASTRYFDYRRRQVDGVSTSAASMSLSINHLHRRLVMSNP